MRTNKKRWRFWSCYEGNPKNRKAMMWCASQADKDIKALRKKGFEAKRWAPRPEHLKSGHFHIVVLCTFDELCQFSGILELQETST